MQVIIKESQIPYIRKLTHELGYSYLRDILKYNLIIEDGSDDLVLKHGSTGYPIYVLKDYKLGFNIKNLWFDIFLLLNPYDER